MTAATDVGATAATTGTDGTGSPPVAPPVARLRDSVELTKREVFDACQALADADPVLMAAGRTGEAAALFDLFELFEERLTG
jgi:hypothetical protein